MSTQSAKTSRIFTTGLGVTANVPDYFRELFGTPEEIQAAITADKDRIRGAGFDVTQC